MTGCLPGRLRPVVAAGLIAIACLLPARADARDQLAIGVTQFPSTLNPLIDSMLAKSYILAMAHRPVSMFDHDWNVTCRMCTELATFENGRAVATEAVDADGTPTGRRGVVSRVTLRDDVFWGDGVPVTTRDVVFTWKVGRHPDTGVPDRQSFLDVTGIEVHDEKTFSVVSSKLDYLYQASFGLLLPAHLEEAAFAEPGNYRHRTLYQTDPTNPGLYNGPYRITAVSPGASVVLERNAHWKGQSPAFDRIEVRTIEKTAALEAHLLSGAIDYIPGEMGLTLDQALSFEQRHGDRFDVVYKPGLIYEHIDLMLDNPILADLRVRRALLHAIDREAVNARLFEGKQPVAHTMVNPLDWIHTGDVRTYPHDPDRARALLDDAGWTTIRNGIRHDANGTRLALEFMTTAGNRVRELVQQVLQSYWREVGVEVTIRNEPARVLFGQTISNRAFSALAMFAWLSAPESLPRTTLHSNSIPAAGNNWSGQNYTGFRNADMDRLIDEIELELDRTRRAGLWKRVQQIYADQLPVLPLYFRSDAYIIPRWLKGIRPTGHLAPTTNWIEEWRVE